MPLYTYECNKCGVRFERRQGFDDDPVRTCPECRGKVHRLIQPAGVIFKGSGFYSTDHKGASSSTKTATGANDKSGSDSTSKSESTKSDSKSETSAETKSAAPAKTASSEN